MRVHFLRVKYAWKTKRGTIKKLFPSLSASRRIKDSRSTTAQRHCIISKQNQGETRNRSHDDHNDNAAVRTGGKHLVKKGDKGPL